MSIKLKACSMELEVAYIDGCVRGATTRQKVSFLFDESNRPCTVADDP